MQVSVTFRNTEAEDWFKDYVNDRLTKVRKFLDKPLEAHVILTVEKFRNIAEVNLLAKGINVNGKEEAKDMQLAFDSVMDKIETQLKKHKEKTRNHKENGSKREAAGEAHGVEEFDGDEHPKVTETRRIVLTPMSLDDAVMKLEANNNRFVVYRDSMSEKVSVLYRKEDGNFGLIETSS
jgi:putative sigma-54 modulation protein